MEGFALKGFIARNWFKLALALLLIFIVLKKDLSFQIRLKAPVLNEQQQAVPPPAERRASRETLSESRDLPAAGASETYSAPVDRFDFSSPGRSSQADPDKTSTALDEPALRAFVDRFSHVAVNEHKKFDIPASLIMGNALLLSGAGKNDIARKGNNFFALPCSRDWRGRSTMFQGSCYRRYENAWTSFRDHSLYLTTGKLAFLREEHGGDDYSGWARGLEKEGFYEDGGTAAQVIELIRRYGLHELDE